METPVMPSEPELISLVEQLACQDWRRVAQVEQRLLSAGEAGMQAVIAGMMHADSRVRRACAGFMDHHGDDRCLISLTERLLNDPVPNVRRTAIHSLGCDSILNMPVRWTSSALPSAPFARLTSVYGSPRAASSCLTRTQNEQGSVV